MVGFCAWALLLSIVVWSSGEEGLVLRVAAPSLLVSVALGSIACLVLGLVDRLVRDAFSSGDPSATQLAQKVRVDAILACVLCSCGVLLFYVDAAVVPMLEDSPRVADAMQSTGSALSLPMWSPTVCAAVGVWRAWCVVARLRG